MILFAIAMFWLGPLSGICRALIIILQHVPLDPKLANNIYIYIYIYIYSTPVPV